jgi:hypothetical protein
MSGERGAPPAIAADAWGRIELEDGRTFKDAKLWPGGAREWDWRETGTGHQAGIQPEDVDELLEHEAEVVVLTRGRLGRLRVPAETLARLEQAGVEAEVLKTAEALERYEALRKQGRPVGALVHSTC